MIVKIEIKTPKGQAKGTVAKLKPLLIGINRVKSSSWVNKSDDTFYLEVDGDVRSVMNISKNAQLYSVFIDQVFKQKVMGKSVKDLANSKEDIQELENMLKNGTTVNVIKQATADELVESNKTFWQKMKENFNRV